MDWGLIELPKFKLKQEAIRPESKKSRGSIFVFAFYFCKIFGLKVHSEKISACFVCLMASILLRKSFLRN